MGFCYFFPIYIKLHKRSSNSYHSQEAPVTWPNQAFYSLTHPPFHVAFVFCWLCLFLWLTAGYTVTQSHTLILCSFSFNNQPISILYTGCIHFLPQQNTDFYLTLPCRIPHLLCSMSQLQVLIPTPQKKHLLCMIAPSLHSSLFFGSTVSFSLQNLYFKSNLCSLSYSATQTIFSPWRTRAIISVSLKLHPHLLCILYSLLN